MAARTAPFAAFYGAIFLALGVYLPFWPVWLGSRGLDAAEIGLLLALGTWIRVATGPAIAHLVDRRGWGKGALVVLVGLSLASFAAFLPANGFWALLVVTLVSAVWFLALVPLAESQTMTAVLRDGLDYGRVRLWGSVTFIAGNLGAGLLLTGRNADLVLLLILAALAAALPAAAAFPRQARASGRSETRLRALFGPGRYLRFIVGASLLQASHAAYYGFSALHWREAGLSAGLVGALWAEGVLAEVGLFALGGALVARFGPSGLLLLAGAAGLVRWSILGLTTAVPALIAVQALHAATFGAAHLAAMHFIARTAPPGLSATAQSLYAALSGGIAMGLALLLAGRLYALRPESAFLAMAALSAAGTALAFALWRAERSGAATS